MILYIENCNEKLYIFLGGNNENIVEFTPNYSVDYCKVAKDTYAIQLNNYSYMLKFKTHIGKVF